VTELVMLEKNKTELDEQLNWRNNKQGGTEVKGHWKQ